MNEKKKNMNVRLRPSVIKLLQKGAKQERRTQAAVVEIMIENRYPEEVKKV